MKPRLLILADWFPPAHKAGGPIRSVANMAKALQAEFELAVITGDRDWGSATALEGIPFNTWTHWEGIPVFYADQHFLQSAAYRQLILEWKPDFVHMNSLYSKPFTLQPIRWLRNTSVKLVLAPRNMLNREALNIKPLKKKLFLWLFRLFHVQQRVIWHASSAAEVQDIKSQMGAGLSIFQAGNFPDMQQPTWKSLVKNSGELRLVAMMRVSRMKNLEFLLQALAGLKGKWNLDVYGNVEEQAYFDLCQQLIDRNGMSAHIHWKGPLPYEQVKLTILDYHFLVLPSVGENYGHAIADAFIAGRPVIISDRTPWKQLQQKQLGWEIPLETTAWRQVLETALQMENKDWEPMTAAARAFGSGLLDQTELKKAYQRIFS